MSSVDCPSTITQLCSSGAISSSTSEARTPSARESKLTTSKWDVGWLSSLDMRVPSFFLPRRCNLFRLHYMGCSSCELSPEHSIGPGELHRRHLDEVAETLLRAIETFVVAIEEHRHNVVRKLPRERSRLRGFPVHHRLQVL